MGHAIYHTDVQSQGICSQYCSILSCCLYENYVIFLRHVVYPTDVQVMSLNSMWVTVGHAVYRADVASGLRQVVTVFLRQAVRAAGVYSRRGAVQLNSHDTHDA